MPSFYTPLLLPPALLKAQQAFGFALLRHVAQATPQVNVFLSPFSVATALMLALEGSAGPARTAILTTLQVAEIPPDKLAAAVARQLATLTQEAPGQPVFQVANAIWANKSFALAPAFAARLRQQYRAETATLDFADPSAAATINAWVNHRTQGRITHLVEAVALAQQTSLVLANAVYFKGQWAAKFDKARTQPGPFTLADGTQRLVPLMRRCSMRFGWQQGAGWQAVRLHYEGYPRSASMQLFIPDQPTGLPGFLTGLGAENWAQWQAGFAQSHHPSTEVDLTLPRFRLEWEANVTAALGQLGLGPALTPSAGFAPMGFQPDAPGFISQIAHKTYLAVDEEGTEAAGVTALMMAGAGFDPTPPRRVVVKADRPFFCAIVDDETGTILFSGAVYNPA